MVAQRVVVTVSRRARNRRGRSLRTSRIRSALRSALRSTSVSLRCTRTPITGICMLPSTRCIRARCGMSSLGTTTTGCRKSASSWRSDTDWPGRITLPRQNAGSGAGDFEAYRGGASFPRWIREEARPALLEARKRGDWQALHIALAGCGLEIKPRGAGLMIGRRAESRLHVKASDIDRLLSMRSLSATLGPYQPPHQQSREQRAEVAYEPGTPKRAGALYKAFQKERDRAVRERTAALAALSVRHRAYAEHLTAWYRERFRQERSSGLAGALRRDAVRHLREKQREDRTMRIRREVKERHDVRTGYRIPTWQGWLEAEAARGNEEALAALRSRARRRELVAAQLLAAENADEARHGVRRHLRPAIRRDGRVIYQLSDGGAVSDEAHWSASVRSPKAQRSSLCPSHRNGSGLVRLS